MTGEAVTPADASGLARPRVLAVTGARTLSPQGSGGSKRQWQLVTGLRRRGFEVTTLAIDPAPAAAHGPTRPDDLTADLELPARPRNGFVAKAQALVSPLPEVIWTRPVGKQLTSEIAAHDLLLLLGPDGIGILPQARQAHLPVVLDQHDVPDLLIRRIAATLPRRRSRWRMLLDGRKWQRYQSSVLGKVDLVVAVSEPEAEVFRSLADARVVVRPNGVDLARYEFRDHSIPEGARLLMTADFSYLPNIDATRWLTAEIFPKIHVLRPDATLHLVGRHAPRGALPAGVSATPDVPEIQPFFDDADVFIVPIRAGAGTRLKIVEAMAKGLPIVSTTIGCEGLEGKDGIHLLVADSADKLAAAAVRLLADETLRRRLARQARTLVEERYGWDGIVDAFAGDLHGLLGETAPP